MRSPVVGLLAGLMFLVVIICTIGGTFALLYSGLIRLNLPAALHALLGLLAIVFSVFVGAWAAFEIDRRLINRTSRPRD